MDGFTICLVGLGFVIALAALVVALGVQRDLRQLRDRYGELQMQLEDLRWRIESSGPEGGKGDRRQAYQRYLDRIQPGEQRPSATPEQQVTEPEGREPEQREPERRGPAVPPSEAGVGPTEEPQEVQPAETPEPAAPPEPKPSTPPTTPYADPYPGREERKGEPAEASALGSYASEEDFSPQEAPISQAETPADKRRPVSWEERLGANLFVWIGAIALALAGAFLVKFTFDRGLLSPMVRVLLGLAFGGALVGVAEWMRKRSDRIAQGLAAAGIADLFACLWAAVNMYHLISPMAGFFCMAGVTALAVVLSLRHGPFVAGLGLIGGFVTPILVDTGKPQLGLFAYLFFLELGLLAVTRRRSWWLLSGLTLLGGMGWTLAWLTFWFQPEHGIWLGLFLLGSTTLFVLSAQYRDPERAWGSRSVVDGLTWTGAMAGLLLVCLLVGVAEFNATEWLFFGVLGAGCLALGRLQGRYEGMAWLAFGASAVMLIVWAIQGKVSPAGLEEIRFGWTAAGLGALYVFGAYGCQWRSDRQVRWAAMSVAAGLAFLLIAYWQTGAPPVDVRWGSICLTMAVLYALGAVPLQRVRGSLATASSTDHQAVARGIHGDDGTESAPETSGAEYYWRITHALAAMLVGATAMVSLAVPIELEREWLAVAWALEVPALALLFVWLNVRALKTLGLGLTVLVAAYLVCNVNVLDFPIGENWPFNWLLYGYGVPVVALSIASVLYRLREDGRYVYGFEAAAILLSFVLVTLEYQQYLRPGNMRAYDLTLGQWSGLGTTWLVFAMLLMVKFRWLKREMLQWGGAVASVLAVGLVGITLVIYKNPLFVSYDLGTRQIYNILLAVYGLPAVLLFVQAVGLRPRIKGIAPLCGLASLAMLLMLITLEVRQYFHPNHLNVAELPLTEAAAIGISWLVVGWLLLFATRRWQSEVVTWAGKVVLATAIVALTFSTLIFMNPLWHEFTFGRWQVFNRLLPIYGLPALLMFLGAWDLKRQNQHEASRVYGILSVVYLLALITFETRHYFHPNALHTPEVPLTEGAAIGIGWLMLGWLLMLAARRWSHEVILWGGRAVLATAVTGVVVFTMFVRNPLWVEFAVGETIIFNRLLAVYGLPVVLALLGAWELKRQGELNSARVFAVAALLLAFTLISLEVRQAFQGSVLTGGKVTIAEQYGYSLAWMVYGVILLVIGIMTGGVVPRYASLVIMLLSVGKVFIVDTAHLEDLYRVFSFLGLGVSLLVLAFLYQRFVFKKPSGAAGQMGRVFKDVRDRFAPHEQP